MRINTVAQLVGTTLSYLASFSIYQWLSGNCEPPEACQQALKCKIFGLLVAQVVQKVCTGTGHYYLVFRYLCSSSVAIYKYA